MNLNSCNCSTFNRTLMASCHLLFNLRRRSVHSSGGKGPPTGGSVFRTDGSPDMGALHYVFQIAQLGKDAVGAGHLRICRALDSPVKYVCDPLCPWVLCWFFAPGDGSDDKRKLDPASPAGMRR